MSQDKSDLRVLAGKTGTGAAAPFGVRAYDVTAVVNAIDILEVETYGAYGVWLSMKANVGWYAIVADATTQANDPDPAAITGGAGSDDEVCLYHEAGYEWVRYWDQTRPYLKVLSDGVDGVLRVERVSIIFGGSNEGA